MDLRVKYVVDPDDPMITDKVDQIDDLVKDFTYRVNLEKGLINYEVDISRLKNENNKEKVESLIEEITYSPVSILLSKDTVKDLDLLILGAYLEGIKEIILECGKNILNSPVDFVQLDESESLYTFTLMTELGTPVYENNAYLDNFYSKCDPQTFVGYQVLNTDPLTRWVLEKWYTEDYTPEDINVFYLELDGYSLPIYPVGQTTYLQTDNLALKDRLSDYIVTLRKKGYFTYRVEYHDLESLEYIRELSDLWNIEIISEENLSLLVLRSDIDFTISTEEWFRKSLQSIKIGSFPKYKVTGEWQFSYNNDYNRLWGQQWKNIIVKYCALLSYNKLALQNNEVIIPFTSYLNVGLDLSVNIYIPTYKLATKFKQYLEEYLKDELWMMKRVNSLREGIIQRWMIQQVDDSSIPMILTNIKNVEEYILIWKSPLNVEYPSPFTFNKDIKVYEESLRKDLLQYYSFCKDNFEPVLRERISELSLDELLYLVPVKENGLTYCFSQDTLNKLDKKINPLTRRDISEKALLRSEQLILGLKGLFNIGHLYGLYDDVPYKRLVKPKIGFIDIYRENTDKIMKDLVGNLFNVDVIFKDNTRSPLFKISLSPLHLEQIDQLNKYVDKLWTEGFFLSYWDSAVEKYKSSKITSYSVTVTNRLLIQAADSRTDGQIALDYLESLN